jgi:serine/threonine-protein kinase
VYRAWDTRLNGPVALKENFDASATAQKQFALEASILFNLHHPNLPRMMDHFSLPSGQYLVMDYIEGEDLQQKLEQQAPLPEGLVRPWIEQVCDALTYLHGQTPPIIHRDIKPANIKITPTGQALLVDFGIAKVYDPRLKTTLGARAVTPGYSPYEQYGQKPTDARTDVYALGATLYTLLTGTEPPESIDRLGGTPLFAPRSLNPALSPQIEKVILQAMAVQPDQRFQDIAAFKAAMCAPPVSRAGTVRVAPVIQEPEPSRGRAGGGAVWGGVGIGLAVMICLIGLVIVLIGGNWAIGRNTNKTPATGSPTPENVAIAFTDTIAPSEVPVEQTPTHQRTTAAQTPTVTKTNTPPLPTPSKTPSPKPPTQPVSCTLSKCDTSTEDVCIYSFAPQSSSLLIALKFEQPVSAEHVPNLVVNGVPFDCAPLSTYPDRLYCTGASTSGDTFLQLMSADNQALCAGSVDIPKYVTPVPTPKNTKVPDKNYP